MIKENKNQKRAKLLGMPYGTANSQLRKMLLFDMAQRLDVVWCYRCSYRIETIEEFSIEHTIPWQGAENPRETFFDISKIRYSHLSCNVKAGYRKKIEVVNGERWCAKGSHYQPVEYFTLNQSACGPCRIKENDIYRREKDLRPRERKYSRGSKYPT